MEPELVIWFRKQHPEFAQTSIRLDEKGWANQVLIVDERLVFRFPRTDAAKQELARELQVLPALQACSPVPVPDFSYIGSERPYVGYSLIEGVPLSRELFVQLNEAERSQLAATLGTFLTALHSLPGARFFDQPCDALQKWRAFYEEIRERLYGQLAPADQERTTQLFTSFLEEERHFQYTPCVIHGDLSSDHLLWNQRLAGIIDFGDLEWGDPAYDFVGLVAEYGVAFLHEVLRSYHREQDETFLHRILHFYLPRLPYHAKLHSLQSLH